MYSFAVCDDEQETADGISDRLYGYFGKKGKQINVSVFYSGASLLGSVKGFDAVFLDVKMPAPDGIEAARSLRKAGFEGIIVFITVLADYVYDSFEVTPFDYIVKPINEGRFLQTLSRLDDKLESNNRRLIIQNNGNKRIIHINDIVYCEVIDRRVYIHTVRGEVVSFYGTLEGLEGSLGGVFFKCHRSYIVNLSRITDFSNGAVRMSDESRIPVSRLRKKELEQALILNVY